jgi:hypothetical protein
VVVVVVMRMGVAVAGAVCMGVRMGVVVLMNMIVRFLVAMVVLMRVCMGMTCAVCMGVFVLMAMAVCLPGRCYPFNSDFTLTATTGYTHR